ncbi:HPF/RaiA family ribosome-associated protein [Agarivorans sp. TSD2052]|uniref:HPF/RaiA family ribosome-associated protein n=1 Tax=Agarivorans sp. TSD2052 TaxID=2937286 RepID=UPI00200D4195|nr:HPF/RaiA family ribosome-associated protein [Agarivorans sp. TSD2052]UPW17881.1 HPF/RaiA family ribosome-associated protein [Agarivorans sp. TSD2052]
MPGTMKIDMHAQHFPLGDSLQEYIRRRINFALGSQYDNIMRIAVKLSDSKEAKGAAGKRCQILVKLAGQADVVIEDIQSQLYVAIDRAASRASRSVTRRIARMRNKALRAPSFSSADYDDEHQETDPLDNEFSEYGGIDEQLFEFAEEHQDEVKEGETR